MPRFSNFLGAIPLLLWYGWGLWQQIPVFIQRCVALSANDHIDGLFALQVVAQAAIIAFTAFLIIVLIFRAVPRVRARGFAPYIAAMIGTFAASTFLLLPAATLSTMIFAIATTLVIVGFGLSLYTLIYLGRSFAILPSARTLITDGPYRYIRHPLYLFEEIAIIGIVIQYAQPWSLLVAVIHFAAQLGRMHYEEKALTEAFPIYASYATRTNRIIPGIY